MAPIISFLNAALALTSQSCPASQACHQSTQTATAIGSSTSPSILASRLGRGQARFASITTSTTTVAASIHPSSSPTVSSAAAPITNPSLELRQEADNCETGYVSCANPGGVVCVGSVQFGICAMNNCALVQDLAQGVNCAIFNPNEMYSSGIVRTAKSTLWGASTVMPSGSAAATATPSSPSAQATTSAPGVQFLQNASPSSSEPSKVSYSIVNASPTSTTSGGGSGNGTNTAYTTYTGDGSQFPDLSQWLSFDDLWTANLNLINSACGEYGANSPDETAAIKAAVQSAATGSKLDPRFILALVMQESRGCVRVVTTSYSHANPGLLQDFDGPNSCNVNGVTTTPCPTDSISGMVNDGVFGEESPGQAKGDGLMQLYKKAGDEKPVTDAAQYYITARLYNSGSYVDDNLGCGVATHCYASDVANRLMGFTGNLSPCSPDAVFSNCSSDASDS